MSAAAKESLDERLMLNDQKSIVVQMGADNDYEQEIANVDGETSAFIVNNPSNKTESDDVNNSSTLLLISSECLSSPSAPQRLPTSEAKKVVSFDPSLLNDNNSNNNNNSKESPMCRICHSDEPVKDLIAPCNCSGTAKYVHQTCLQNWLKINGIYTIHKRN